jgi:hypothetical protein
MVGPMAHIENLTGHKLESMLDTKKELGAIGLCSDS